MIKHIIFDLGNVILNIHPQRAMELFAKRSGVPQNQIEKFYLSDLHLDFMKGEYTPQEFYDEMNRRYQFDLEMDDFFSIWIQVIGEPKEGIIEIIEQLAAKFTMSICSNTDSVHWNYCLQQFPFLQRFQHYFLSFEMKRNKPDLEVFEEILSTLGAQGEECVFIDDTVVNIEAAYHVGFLGIHAEEPQVIRQQLEGLNLL